MITRWNHVGFSLIAIALLAGPAASDEPLEADDHTTLFMRAKLRASNEVMEGIVTEDFKMVRRAALDMKRMSSAVEWPTAKDPTYQHYQRAFQLECDELAKLAEDKNLAGTHFTFLQLTSNCVACHRYVRRSFRVERDKEHPQGRVILIPNHWEETTPSDTEASYKPQRSRKERTEDS